MNTVTLKHMAGYFSNKKIGVRMFRLKAYLSETLLLASVLFLLSPHVAKSEVRTSENYRIFADTLSSGGQASSSTNFRVWDAIGEVASEENSTSTNFATRIGFSALNPDNALTVTTSRSSVNFRDVVSTIVTSNDLDVTYATNANGFTSTISADGALRTSGGSTIGDVADGEVTAGQSEYGIRTSGSMGQQNNADTSITTTAKTIASRTDPAPSNSITITFKVSVAPTTPEGDYNQEVTITTTGNY